MGLHGDSNPCLFAQLPLSTLINAPIWAQTEFSWQDETNGAFERAELNRTEETDGVSMMPIVVGVERTVLCELGGLVYSC